MMSGPATATKNKKQSKQATTIIPIELQKAEEETMRPAVPVEQLIKTRGQLEEEEIEARARSLRLQREEAQRAEAQRYSKYLRFGLFVVVCAGTSFLAYRYLNKKDTNEVTQAVVDSAVSNLVAK